MSKFQVGDYVQHREREGWHGEVSKAGILMTLTNQYGSFVGHEDFDLVAKAGEWVPDVDGNPIRVGVLVEHGDGRIVRVRGVVQQPDQFSYDNPAEDGLFRWERRTTDWRVLTADDLHRPPEPPTRDVALRVVVHDVPESIREDSSVAGDVKSHCEGRWPNQTFTVEVIEDGGSHE